MRRLKYLLLIITLVFIGMLNVKAIDTSEKVYDFANVLTPEQKENLKARIDTFIETYNLDMAIVTVRYHDYSSTEKYADDLHDKLIEDGFGIDSIICILDFNINLHKNVGVQISTNGNSIVMYDDARIEKIIDEIADAYYRNRTDYYNMFNAFIDRSSYYANLGIPESNRHVKIDKNGRPYIERPFPWMQISIISIIVSSVTVLILIKRNKMIHKATNADLYLNKETINITNRKDQFLTTATTRVRISSDSSSGGGRAGGSSFHSSGGGFHGGGGRSL